jgi:hypothetical protein
MVQPISEFPAIGQNKVNYQGQPGDEKLGKGKMSITKRGGRDFTLRLTQNITITPPLYRVLRVAKRPIGPL